MNYIKRFFSLLIKMIETEIEYTSVKLQESKQNQGINEYYIQAGKAIEDISNRYPTSYEDAVIIFEEWSKGVLSNHRPRNNTLREYAKYTATSESWWNWIKYKKATKS